MARILIIEDNPANIELMSFLLSAYGHTPLAAPDGARGVAAVRSERPDLVACDVNLPGMDGYAVLAALKAEPELAAIPVLAVTALAMAGDREHVLAAGFDGYISKPIEPESFVAELEAFLPAAAEAASSVLLVEDDGFMLGVLADMLSGQDYRVLTAASGEDALGVLEREPVEVIVCDQDMPGMTGTALLAEAARRYPASVRLMLTGQSDLAEIEAAMAAGVVDAHHAKPVGAGELRGHVEEALRLHRRRKSSPDAHGVAPL